MLTSRTMKSSATLMMATPNSKLSFINTVLPSTIDLEEERRRLKCYRIMFSSNTSTSSSETTKAPISTAKSRRESTPAVKTKQTHTVKLNQRKLSQNDSTTGANPSITTATPTTTQITTLSSTVTSCPTPDPLPVPLVATGTAAISTTTAHATTPTRYPTPPTPPVVTSTTRSPPQTTSPASSNQKSPSEWSNESTTSTMVADSGRIRSKRSSIIHDSHHQNYQINGQCDLDSSSTRSTTPSISSITCATENILISNDEYHTKNDWHVNQFKNLSRRIKSSHTIEHDNNNSHHTHNHHHHRRRHHNHHHNHHNNSKTIVDSETCRYRHCNRKRCKQKIRSVNNNHHHLHRHGHNHSHHQQSHDHQPRVDSEDLVEVENLVCRLSDLLLCPGTYQDVYLNGNNQQSNSQKKLVAARSTAHELDGKAVRDFPMVDTSAHSGRAIKQSSDKEARKKNKKRKKDKKSRKSLATISGATMFRKVNYLKRVRAAKRKQKAEAMRLKTLNPNENSILDQSKEVKKLKKLKDKRPKAKTKSRKSTTSAEERIGRTKSLCANSKNIDSKARR